MKYKDNLVEVSRNPIMIVGQNPGGQRKNTVVDGICWHGNRSADLVFEAIGDSKNIILTNAFQYRDISNSIIEESFRDMVERITFYQPRKIIVLGVHAHHMIKRCLTEIGIKDIPVVEFNHPSYVLRFSHKSRNNYIEKLQEELK